jgi:hypothetical protein
MSPVSPKNEPLIGIEVYSAANHHSRAMKSQPVRGTSAVYKHCLGLCLLLFCCSLSAHAQLPGQPTPSPSPTSGIAGAAKQLYNFYKKITPSRGFRFVTGSIVPGSGLSAGLGYGASELSQKWRVNFNGSARVSTKKYWEIDSNVRLTQNKPSSGDTVGNLKIDFYGVIKDMPRLDFFGLGPNSREQDRAVFHYREAAVGIDIVKPVAPMLDIGGAIEGIFPRIIRIANPTVRSVERVYSEAAAPGIRSQPNFLHLVGYAEFHSVGQPESRKLSYKFYFNFFRDGRDHLYSFRRFDADLTNKFPFGKNEFRIRGRASLSDTSTGQRVPFYLMETLGGSNIRGVDTLRGFRDYRFRDRDLLLLQLEYMREIKGPVDFITFYDTGKVASSISRFDVGRWRHTYGFGVVIVPRRGEDVFFRFYVALGSGEGAHTYVGLGDPLNGRGDRLIR